MKPHRERIRYYLHKAVQYSAKRYPERKPGSLRFKRLMAYKEALNKKLKEQKLQF